MTSIRLFLTKLLIFLVIPIVTGFIILLFLPIDLFNFRSWEALLPAYISAEGRFYPNQYLEKIEVGDLGVRTEYAIEKHVEFYTDAYGFRYVGLSDELIDIIIVGDSFTVGSALTQEHTLANQLSITLDRSVYPYAPATVTQYMTDSRFADNPPEYVILQVVERNLARDFCPMSTIPIVSPPSEIPSRWLHALIRLDVVLRTPTYFYGYFSNLRNDTQVIANEETRMLFYNSSLMPPNINVEALTSDLLNCQQWVESRGSQLIFTPIPDKETIYFNDIPQSYRPDMNIDERQRTIANLIISTSEAGILTIDFLAASEIARDNRNPLYHLDDTHWNAEGVRVFVDLIQNLLESERN